MCFETLVKTVRPILEEATEIHGITDIEISHAPTFDVVHSRLAELLQGKKEVCDL